MAGVLIGSGVSFVREGLASRGAPPQAARSEVSPHDLLEEVKERVSTEYVELLPDGRLEQAAVEGVIASLDPHSAFLDAAAYDEMRVNTAGSYTGIGIEVTAVNDRVTVVAPIEGSPAERAGVLSGDVAAGGRRHRGQRLAAQRGDRAPARVPRLARPAGGEPRRRGPTPDLRSRAFRGPRADRPRRAPAGRLRLRPHHPVQRLDSGRPGRGAYASRHRTIRTAARARARSARQSGWRARSRGERRRRVPRDRDHRAGRRQNARVALRDRRYRGRRAARRSAGRADRRWLGVGLRDRRRRAPGSRPRDA